MSSVYWYLILDICIYAREDKSKRKVWKGQIDFLWETADWNKPRKNAQCADKWTRERWSERFFQSKLCQAIDFTADSRMSKVKNCERKKSQKEKYDARTKEHVKGRSKAEKAQVAIRVDGKLIWNETESWFARRWKVDHRAEARVMANLVKMKFWPSFVNHFLHLHALHYLRPKNTMFRFSVWQKIAGERERTDSSQSRNKSTFSVQNTDCRIRVSAVISTVVVMQE